jgi:RNA polymerase sigma-70 factor (ECF subfamily)
VRYFVRRGLAPDAAEDCVQEVFVRVARIDQGRVENAEAYLFTIAASVAVDRSRAARSRHELCHDPLDDLIPGGDFSPARVLEGRQALEQLAAVLDELPERTRELFLLNRLEGLSYTQIAARFAISVKTVEKQMSRALAHLRRRYPSGEAR